MTAKISTRRYDLDWLRVLGMLLVFIYHSTRFFNLGDWHVKNPVTYIWVETWNEIASTWLMPFMFLISGASLFYALGKSEIKWNTVFVFIKDKVLRLLVPLLVGIFSHAALQVYLERITHGQFRGTFLQFVPHYFDGVYGFGGNFALVGMHLWYLAILFILSLVCLPVFLLLRTKPGSFLLDKLTRFFAFPGFVYVLVLVNVLSWKLIDPDSILGFDKMGCNLGIYLSYFLCGYIIFSSQPLQLGIQKVRWISLAVSIVLIVLHAMGDDHEDLLGWFTILTFLGFGLRYLNINNPFLKYANEAVLPFYILHQTILLCVGYYIVRWPIPDLLKWMLVMIISFPTILAAYEFLVRRNNLMRILFGMKPLTRSAAPVTKELPLTKTSQAD
jgi:peptidoglycan/LPS O-acetylase OafA/YrhL